MSGEVKKQDFLSKRGYAIGEKIGSGGFGNVYKAKRKGKTVAVKVVKLNESKRLDLELRRELVILSRLRHPNVVLCYDIMKTSTKVYIFMEYASGGNIARIVRHNDGLPEWGAKILFVPVTDALIYIHGQGIAHRDLKLENILLDEYFNPKLADFGLSKYVRYDEDGKVYKTDSVCGTESYMPPELIDKKEHDPILADIWSLGICLYVMLNNSYPFDRHNLNLMLYKQINRDWSFKKKILPYVSSELIDLTQKLLSPECEQRISLENVRKHAWIYTNKQY